MDSTDQSDQPYQQWLKIPAELCPPNHYVLLGVDEFCTDQDAIDAASKKRTAYLHQIAAGPNRKVIQRLLGEIAIARRTLLNAQSRQDYDTSLLSGDDEPDPQTAAVSIQPNDEREDEPDDEQDAVTTTFSRTRSAAADVATAAESNAATGTAVGSTARKSPSRRKPRSPWDAYKLHFLSASVLACAVGIFAFVNRDGGRRASQVPDAGQTPLGPGFQRQTAPKRPTGAKPTRATKRPQVASGAKQTTRPRRVSSGLTGPAGFDPTITTSPDSTTPSFANLPRFDRLDSDPLDSPSSDSNPPGKLSFEKDAKLPPNWLDGLATIAVFNGKFHRQFKSPVAHRKVVKIENNQLTVLTSKSKTVYPQFICNQHQLTPLMAVAFSTSMRPGMNKAAAVGLVVGNTKIVLQSTEKGVSIRTHKRTQKTKARFICNVTVAADVKQSTLVVARDAKKPSLLHWIFKAGTDNRIGTIETDLTQKAAPIGISVTCPDTPMKQPLTVSNLRIGALLSVPDWPQ